MVIVSDIKNNFFNPLLGERVLVFVGADVDAVCSWKILKHLFRCKHILYSVVIIKDKEDLLSAFQDYKIEISHVVMLNCGANFDVIDFLNPSPDSDLVFYICDSRRPIHINNYYNQRRVKLLIMDETLDDIPAYEDVFRDDSSDEDSDNEDDEAPNKRNRFDQNYLERRIQKRAWNRKRQQILLEYESYSHYGSSSAYIMFDLAWKLSLDNNNLLWSAIVGQTSQLIYQRINRDQYMETLDSLQGHVTRLSHAVGGTDEKMHHLIISLEEDLALWLYRHWNLKDSLETSMLTASQLKLFTLKGRKRMLDLLAQMGIPHREFIQSFSAMDMNIKHNLTRQFSEQAEKFGLSREELFLPVFIAKSIYRSEISAVDATLICAAVLEASENGSPCENFQSAMETLNCYNSSAINSGLELAQRQLKSISNQVQTFLETDEIIVFGPFFYAHLLQNSLAFTYVRNSLSQILLAKYILTIKASLRPNLGRNRKSNQMPLILCVDKKEPGMLTLLGIPPLQGGDTKNLFGQAFETAAKSTRSKIQQKSFDANIVEMNKEDMLKLFEAIASLLT